MGERKRWKQKRPFVLWELVNASQKCVLLLGKSALPVVNPTEMWGEVPRLQYLFYIKHQVAP